MLDPSPLQTIETTLAVVLAFKHRYPAPGSPMVDYARYYARRGWHVFPVHSRTASGLCTCGKSMCDKVAKHPHITQWQEKATTDEAQIQEWWSLWPNANIGGLMGAASGVIALDVDPRNGGDQGLAERLAAGFALPLTVEASTGGGGRHLLFQHPGVRVKKDNKGLVAEGVDAQGDGSYILLPPSLHATGNVYAWQDDFHLDRTALASMPDWLVQLLARRSDTAPRAASPSAPPAEGEEGWAMVERQLHRGYALAALGYACNALASAPPGQRNGAVFAQAAAMGELVGAGALDREEVEQALLAAAPIAVDFTEDEALTAMANGLDRGEQNPRDLSGLAHSGGRRFRLNEGGNADELVARHGETIRHVQGIGWLVFDGQRWVPDQVAVVELARGVLRDLRFQADALAKIDGKAAQVLYRHIDRSDTARGIDGMLKLAASKPSIRVTLDDMDRDPWLLNVNNGTIDLRTGALHPHDKRQLLTKLVPVNYRPDAPCPTWLRFLREIMAEDEPMVMFLQRAIGYSITGLTTEQRLFIAYGTGRNGKSVFMGILLALLGGYGAETPAATLIVNRRGSGINNDVARLQGVHFVSANETEDGAWLDEAKVKALTGGDKVVARYMYKEFFEFTPKFTPWLRTNSLPLVKSVDQGIWRRLVPVPFAVTIREEDVDRDLYAKLLAELEGILSWAVTGCLAWQAQGLDLPAQVKVATQGYKDEQDTVQQFIEWCPLIPERVKAMAFYGEYVAFCKMIREIPLSQKGFGMRLTDLGWGTSKNTKPTYRLPPRDVQRRADESGDWGEAAKFALSVT